MLEEWDEPKRSDEGHSNVKKGDMKMNRVKEVFFPAVTRRAEHLAMRLPSSRAMVRNKLNPWLRTAGIVVSIAILAAPVLAADSDEELAKKSQNPIANLISLPLQNDWNFNSGPHDDKTSYTLNVQPVWPFSLSEEYLLITRTILPVKSIEFPRNETGIGDILQSFFLSPKKTVGGWIVGAGPVFNYPTASDDSLGSGKWGAGPTAVMLRQDGGWTYGLLTNHVWSFAGNSSRSEVSATFLEPFISFTTKTYTSLGLNTESTYDWKAGQWTVPVNFMLQQMVKIGGQPISLQLGYRYYAEKPDHGPDWGVRFQMTFLFPK